MQIHSLRHLLAFAALAGGLCADIGAANGSHVWPPKRPVRLAPPVKTAAIVVPMRDVDATVVPASAPPAARSATAARDAPLPRPRSQ